ncbi:MAG TPA: hypothetical protein VNZ52_06595, partial [Candidatus Thermoplasmatota archaeon]|nr:hypothetical protein [Candidatus Thermoplasmatota archaeon]
FEGRTSLALGGAYRLAGFPTAGIAGLFPGLPGNRTQWVTTLGPGGVLLEADDGAFRFDPLGTGARTLVQAGGETFHFNGTDFTFQFNGTGLIGLHAEGVHGILANGVDVTLRPAPPLALRGALAPRTLLDLQEALRGPEAREPVRNLTALLGNFTRVPTVLNGALVGHLNGTVAGTRFSPEEVTLVRVRSLTARLEDRSLTGTAEAVFTVTPAGFAPAGATASSPPWALGVLLWAGALAALLVVPAPSARRRGPWWLRALLLPAFPLTFLGWDWLVHGALGTSAGSLYLAGEPRGSVAAFLVFEAAGFLLAFLLIAVPLRLAAQRVLGRYVPKATPLSGLVGLVGLFLTAWAIPFGVLALGFLVARL